MQRPYLAQNSVPPGHPPAQMQAGSLNNLLESFMMAIPVLIAIGVLAYRRQRTIALQQRILQLEKLWLLDSVRRSR